MKLSKTLIAVLICTQAFFVGCNNKKTAKDLIVKKWKVTQLTGGMSNTMTDSARQKVLKNLSMEFTGNGQYILTGMDSSTHKGTYSISDDELYLNITPAGTGKPEKNTLNEVTDTELIFTDEGGTRLVSIPK